MAHKRAREKTKTNEVSTDKNPKKKSRKKTWKNINLDDIKVPLTNRFEVLSDSEMDTNDESSNKKPKRISPSVITDIKIDVQNNNRSKT